MEEKWAPDLDTELEIDGSRWPVGDLGRHTYLDKAGGKHARWEGEDGLDARGPGEGPTIFVSPDTGAVSVGDLAHAEAAKYREGLKTAVGSAVGRAVAPGEFAVTDTSVAA